MGMTQSSYVWGWMLTCYVKGMIAILIMIIALERMGVSDSLLELSLIMVLYMLAVTHQTFAISTFFNNPKLAGEIGSFVQQVVIIQFYYFYY